MNVYLPIMIPLYVIVVSIYWAYIKNDKQFSNKRKFIKGLQLLNLLSVFGCIIFLMIQTIMKASWIEQPISFLQKTSLQYLIFSLSLRFWEKIVKKKEQQKI